MTGEDRSWLYTLAIYTGLRRSELQSLIPESFDLESASPPIVSLPGRATKNGQPGRSATSSPCHPGPAILASWQAHHGPTLPAR